MKARIKARPFVCPGCGAQRTPDGTPQNAPFVWYDVKTKEPHSYCYECDGKLLQDVSLPIEKKK